MTVLSRLLRSEYGTVCRITLSQHKHCSLSAGWLLETFLFCQSFSAVALCFCSHYWQNTSCISVSCCIVPLFFSVFLVCDVLPSLQYPLFTELNGLFDHPFKPLQFSLALSTTDSNQISQVGLLFFVYLYFFHGLYLALCKIHISVLSKCCL